MKKFISTNFTIILFCSILSGKYLFAGSGIYDSYAILNSGGGNI